MRLQPVSAFSLLTLPRKIKRIIFESSSKWDGTQEVGLSTSQIKQIGGRAGRYGLHDNSSDGGIVTTLYPEDLPIVRAAMNSELPPIPGAILPLNLNALTTVQQAIPSGGPRFTTVLGIVSLFSRTRYPYIHGESGEGKEIAEHLDTASGNFTMGDTLNWFLSPVAWRDDVARAVAARFSKDHQTRLRVDLKKTLRKEGLLQVLEKTYNVMGARRRVSDPRTVLMTLETLHKSITLYMWLRQRMPVVFPDFEEALEVKEKTEKAMEYVLQAMTKGVGTGDTRNTLPDGSHNS